MRPNVRLAIDDSMATEIQAPIIRIRNRGAPYLDSEVLHQDGRSREMPIRAALAVIYQRLKARGTSILDIALIRWSLKRSCPLVRDYRRRPGARIGPEVPVGFDDFSALEDYNVSLSRAGARGG